MSYHCFLLPNPAFHLHHHTLSDLCVRVCVCGWACWCYWQSAAGGVCYVVRHWQAVFHGADEAFWSSLNPFKGPAGDLASDAAAFAAAVYVSCWEKLGSRRCPLLLCVCVFGRGVVCMYCLEFPLVSIDMLMLTIFLLYTLEVHNLGQWTPLPVYQCLLFYSILRELQEGKWFDRVPIV